MKRDMDLVRSILLAVEDQSGELWTELRSDGSSEKQIGFHTHLAGRAGFLCTVESQGDGDSYPFADALHLTWEGYDFLDRVRKSSTWEIAKQKVKQAGVGFSIYAIKIVVDAITKSTLESAMK